MRIASTPEDVVKAQELRFEVFNVEMNEGLDSSYLSGLDEDPFDAVCQHLLVEFAGEVVGTYRMQTGRNAAAQIGYYSAQEFDFAPLEPLREDIVELGRACVSRNHRNLIVLGLLWRGIVAYARAHGCRYLLGCSSVHSQDAREGAALYFKLRPQHLAPPSLLTTPQPDWACPLDHVADKPPRTPKLLSAYLSIGAKLCGAPAIDQQFKTIDFLTLLDLEQLPANSQNLLS